MKININDENNQITLSPIGNLDTINAPAFGEKLSNVLEKRPTHCFIDMQGVDFLSSSGLQALLSGAKISKGYEIKYTIIGMNEMVNEVFNISGFNHFIDSFSTKEEALA